MLSAPVISDSAPYQKPKNGEGRRQPGPVALVACSAAVRAAVRVGVAGVRHVSPIQQDADGASCQLSRMFRPPLLLFRSGPATVRGLAGPGVRVRNPTPGARRGNHRE